MGWWERKGKGREDGMDGKERVDGKVGMKDWAGDDEMRMTG